jgi:hypothetical protein
VVEYIERKERGKGKEGDDSIHVHVCKEEEGDVARGWTE